MQKEEILAQLKNIIEGSQGFTELSMETTFESLEMDSLDVLETFMECEKHFEIDIPDEEMEGIETIGELVNIIDAKLQNND